MALACANSLSPLYLSRLVDSLANSPLNNWSSFRAVLLLLVVANLAGCALSYCTVLSMSRLSESITRDMRRALLSHTLSVEPVLAMSNGDITAVVLNDVTVVSSFVSQNLSSLVSAICGFLGTAIVLFRMNAILFLVPAAAMPLYWFLYRMTSARITGAAGVARERYGSVCTMLAETLQQRRTIFMHQGQEYASTRFAECCKDLFTAAMAQVRVAAAAKTLMSGISMVTLLCILGIGGVQATKGMLSVGVLMAFSSSVGRLLSPLTAFVGFSHTWLKVKVALAHINTLWSINGPDCPDIPEGERINSIVIQAVKDTVCPDSQGRLHIELRGVISLRGIAGSGKTTLAEMLAGYRASKQVIYVGDSGSYNPQVLSSRVVFLDNSMTLLSASLTENLTLGRKADMSEICRLLQLVELERLVQVRGIGPRTAVSASSFSSGETQQFMLVRALLMKPWILILDEALSGVESQLAKRILSRLQGEVPCVFLVSHRDPDHSLSSFSYLLVDGELIEYDREQAFGV
ncbi:MAG: ABC transporter ATP-binding protein [Bacillota bacterium]|nr:ABC transporter ATP-binding protein [Bacillota bacterium]